MTPVKLRSSLISFNFQKETSNAFRLSLDDV
jgi:hypothetical protein